MKSLLNTFTKCYFVLVFVLNSVLSLHYVNITNLADINLDTLAIKPDPEFEEVSKKN